MPGHISWFHLIYGSSIASVTQDDRIGTLMFYNAALK